MIFEKRIVQLCSSLTGSGKGFNKMSNCSLLPRREYSLLMLTFHVFRGDLWDIPKSRAE